MNNKKIYIFCAVIIILAAILTIVFINRNNFRKNVGLQSDDNQSNKTSITNNSENNNSSTEQDMSNNSSGQSNETTISEKEIDKSGVAYNGWLSVNKKNITNEKGEVFQLRGLSSHGINWFNDVLTYNNLENLRYNWKTNAFRIVVYTDVGSDGYVYNQGSIKENIDNIVSIASKLDMYVIIDWHILADNNPQIHESNAINFFDELSLKYANMPNVIYEICNEPNGQDVTWNNNVKPYAEKVIPVIRKNSPKALILVGTPTWCTDLKPVVENPLNFENIAYTCHFYSGTHKAELRDKITYCLNSDIPIFISECGLTDASGNGGIYLNDFKEWINFINNNNLSWFYWSFSNKNEASAALSSNYNGSNSNMDDYLTESGSFIKSIFQSYNK